MNIKTRILNLKTKSLIIVSLIFVVIYQLFFLRILPKVVVLIAELLGNHLTSSDLPTNYIVGILVRLIGSLFIILCLIKLNIHKQITSKWSIKYLLISWVAFVYIIANIELVPITRNQIPLTILMLISCIMVGLYEEVFFRGFILGILLEKWGNTRNGIYISVFYSSFLFGCIHIFNLFIKGEAPNEVISQVVYAFFFGTFFAAVYIRCNYNLLWCILLHSVYDIADELIKVVHYKKGNSVITNHVASSSNLDVILNLALMLPLFLVGIFLLRKVKKETTL